ncbi:MAG: PAS domain S-box protein [Nitrospiraceae bacterium]|nr:MAG: PAS domain S-box protein [Nitrospiraceae bacterium]
MNEKKKTKEQLAAELRELRRQLDECRKAAHEDKGLLKAEQKYRIFFENTIDATYLIEPETGQILECNPSASRMTGYPVRELLSMTLADLCPLEEQDIISKILLRIAQTGSLSGVTGVNQLHKDGMTIPVEINGSSLQMGAKKYCLVMMRDITERKFADEALKASEDKYRALFKHMFIGFALHRIIVDQKGQPVDYEFLEVNDAFERLTGLKRVQLIGKKVTEVIPSIKKERPDLITIYGDVALRGEVARLELQFIPFNKWYSVSAYSPGKGYFVALFDDITHRKYWEEKLRESESRFRDISENAREWIWEVDAEGRYVYSSPVVKTILGYSPEEIVEKHFYDLFHPDKRESLKKAAFDVFARKEPFRDFVNQNIDKSGSTVWLSTSGIPILGQDGRLLGYRGADADITALKHTEESLIRAQEEWRATFDTIPDLILVTDSRHRITKVNRSLADKLGVDQDALIGRNCFEIIHGTDKPPSYCPHSKTLADGKEHIQEMYEDKLKGHFLTSASPVYDANRKPVGIVEVARDITELKKMEQRLQEAAITDELTGLFNRRGFLSLANHQIRIAARRIQTVSLLYMDVDNMKMINDELGHVEGDRALKAAATIFRNSFRESDIIARIGGDEFAVLMIIHGKDAAEKRSIRSIENGLKKFNGQSSTRYALQISIGKARYDPDHPRSIEELMAEADRAMYEGKKQKDVKRQKAPGESFTEKRSYPRYCPGNECRAQLGRSGTHPVANISMGGVCLEALKRLPRSGNHQITFTDHLKRELDVPGRIVWSGQKGRPAPEDRGKPRFAAALQFTEMTDRVKKSLQDFIDFLAGRH